MATVNPPSGSVIVNFEGTQNSATISCNITNQGVQVTTRWHVAFFRGTSALLSISGLPELFEITGDPVPGTTVSFDNHLTVLNLVSDLDGVMIFCGTGAIPQQAHFFLRIYSEFEVKKLHVCTVAYYTFSR